MAKFNLVFRINLLCCIGVLFTSRSFAQAGGAVACNAALNKDLLSITRSDQQQYAYLNRIDKNTFEELKHSASAGVDIPILKGILGASADYEDFKKKREKLFQEVRYTSSQDVEEKIFQYVTNPIAYTYWAACMEAYSKDNIGFYVWKSEDRPDLMVINYRWHSPPLVKSAKALSQVTGGYVVGAAKGKVFSKAKTFGPNEEGTLQVLRNPGSPSLMVTVVAEGYSAPPLRSFYGRYYSNVGEAFLRIPTEGERLVQSDYTRSGASLDNHDKRCPGNGTPCDGTGTWAASIVELSLDAGQDRYLRNVRWTCDGMPPDMRSKVESVRNQNWMGKAMAESMEKAYANVCSYVSIDRQPSEGQRTSSVAIRSWTRPVNFTLHGDVYEKVTALSEPERAIVYPNQTFTLRDHPGAAGRVVLAKACGIDSPASPGQDSPDGRLKYIGSAGLGAEVYLVYKYLPPPGKNGKPSNSCGPESPNSMGESVQVH